MTSIEIKNILFRKIASINDISVLKAINSLIDSKSDVLSYKTSDEQRVKIENAITQINNGEFFTDEQVELDVNKWLQKE